MSDALAGNQWPRLGTIKKGDTVRIIGVPNQPDFQGYVVNVRKSAVNLWTIDLTPDTPIDR